MHSSISFMPVPPNWATTLREVITKWKSATSTAETYEYMANPPYDKFFLTEAAESWDEFLQWLSELRGHWCFRGQRESKWLLNTSLDRAVIVRHETEYSKGYYHLPRAPIERDFLFRFQQQAHNWVTELPLSDDLCSWLGMMQHHGVPTRLLDWTTSPYVGMYFALEQEPSEKCAVWAVDLNWLQTQCDSWFDSKGVAISKEPQSKAHQLNELLRQTTETEHPVIVEINPKRLNERMIAQQGFFLCMLIEAAGFSNILMGMIFHTPNLDRPVVRKLEVDKNLRIPFLRKLREMNIHRASLFPSLDGFGQSLKVDLEIMVDEAPR